MVRGGGADVQWSYSMQVHACDWQDPSGTVPFRANLASLGKEQCLQSTERYPRMPPVLAALINNSSKASSELGYRSWGWVLISLSLYTSQVSASLYIISLPPVLPRPLPVSVKGVCLKATKRPVLN